MPNDRKTWYDQSIYKFIKDIIIYLFIPIGIIYLSTYLNSAITKREYRLKMVELLNSKIGGNQDDMDYLTQLLYTIDEEYADTLKKIIDKRSIELSFQNFYNTTGDIREKAIGRLVILYKEYPDVVIEGYINNIPDDIQKLKWGPAISIAKGMSLLNTWYGDSIMYQKVKSFEKSKFYKDNRINTRIQTVLNNFYYKEK